MKKWPKGTSGGALMLSSVPHHLLQSLYICGLPLCSMNGKDWYGQEEEQGKVKEEKR